jgi:hypothetical protein
MQIKKFRKLGRKEELRRLETYPAYISKKEMDLLKVWKMMKLILLQSWSCFNKLLSLQEKQFQNVDEEDTYKSNSAGDASLQKEVENVAEKNIIRLTHLRMLKKTLLTKIRELKKILSKFLKKLIKILRKLQKSWLLR